MQQKKRRTSRTITTIPSAPRACAGSAFRRPWGTRRTAAGPVSASTAPGTSSSTARRTAAPTARRCRRVRAIRTATSSLTTPRGGTTPLPRCAQPQLLLFRSNPPLRGGIKRKIRELHEHFAQRHPRPRTALIAHNRGCWGSAYALRRCGCEAASLPPARGHDRPRVGNCDMYRKSTRKSQASVANACYTTKISRDRKRSH